MAQKKADIIAAALIIALIMLAYVATDALADNGKGKRDKVKRIFDNSSDHSPVTPKPTPIMAPGASPTQTPAPTPTPEPLNSPTPGPEPEPVQVAQSLDTQDFSQTLLPNFLMPAPEPGDVRVNNSSEASPSPSARPTAYIPPLPTPLVSDLELTRPGMNIGILFAMLIGLACAGYILFLGYTIIKK